MPILPRDKIVTIEIRFKVSGAQRAATAARFVEDHLLEHLDPIGTVLNDLHSSSGIVTNLTVQEVGLDGRPRF